MLLIGCTPESRHTEQHDVFFGIAEDIRGLLEDIFIFWPEANRKMHIDAWREVNYVDGFSLEIVERKMQASTSAKLFFLNLGGYKQHEFEEYHYKMLVAGNSKTDAIQAAKQTAFYKHTGFTGAVSHIDDKYGVDVDDIHDIEDILPSSTKEKYALQLTAASSHEEDELHIGYLKLSQILKDA